jgi:hypothetical protein
MLLSKQVISTLSDLIENRLSMMTIHDQDDLREKMNLQRALSELQSEGDMPAALLSDFSEIPRRGRRRKVGGMAEA